MLTTKRTVRRNEDDDEIAKESALCNGHMMYGGVRGCNVGFREEVGCMNVCKQFASQGRKSLSNLQI